MAKHDPAPDEAEPKPRSLPGVVSGIWKRGAEEPLSFSDAMARGSRRGVGVASLAADSRWLTVNAELRRMLDRSADDWMFTDELPLGPSGVAASATGEPEDKP